MGKGGSTVVQAPQPTAEEIELQRKQLEILNRQEQEYAMLEPYLLKTMGYEKATDENGKTYLRQLSDEERYAKMTDSEKGMYDLNKLLLQRQKDALEGKLAISPALEKSLEDERDQTIAYLEQRLGPRWRESTPGIQALANLEEKQNLVREEARRGQMTSGEAIMLQNMGFTSGQNQQNLANSTAYPSRLAGLFGQAGAAQGMYQNQRNMQFQANIYNAQQAAQNSRNLWGGLGGLVGTLGGAALMGPFGGMLGASMGGGLGSLLGGGGLAGGSAFGFTPFRVNESLRL